MNKNIKAGANIHAGDGGYSEGTQEEYDKFVKVRNQPSEMKWTLDIKEDPETGDAILEFPDDLLEQAGWREGDVLNWTDNGDGSWTLSKQNTIKDKLREFEKISGLDIYGLGAKRDRWEACLQKYAELIVRDCDQYARSTWEHGELLGGDLKRLYGIDE